MYYELALVNCIHRRSYGFVVHKVSSVLFSTHKHMVRVWLKELLYFKVFLFSFSASNAVGAGQWAYPP